MLYNAYVRQSYSYIQRNTKKYKALKGFTPKYLSDALDLLDSSYNFRNTNDCDFLVPRANL